MDKQQSPPPGAGNGRPDPGMGTGMVYSFRAERTAFILLIILAVLVLIHVLAMQANFNPALGLKEKYGFHYWQHEFFDLDAEESFGTWFNSGLLLLSAILLFNHARWLRSQRSHW